MHAHAFRIQRTPPPWLSAALVGIALAAQTPDAARAQDQAAGAKVASVSSADTDFMRKVAAGGATEVELGKLAATKGASADVKSFGSHMVDDHTKAGDELKQLASSKSVSLPDGPDAKQRGQIDAIGKLDGKAFDAAFKQQMVQDHRTTVAAFQKTAAGGHDADLKAWAKKTLPTLQEHLKMAQALH